MWGQRLVLHFVGSHRNYGGINYYGPGPDSSKDARTNYRLEDTSSDAIAVLAARAPLSSSAAPSADCG